MQPTEPATTTAKRQHAIEIIEWLASDDCHKLDVAGLIAILAAVLRDNGVPVDRLVLHLRAPHPTIFGRSIAWAPGEPVALLNIEHGEELSERIQRSPVLHAMSSREWVVLRTDDRRWMLHDIFLGRGLVELCIAPIIHGASERAVSAVTVGTRRHEGFSEADLALLRRILPALRGAIELKVWRFTTKTMLDTYIGSGPEQRVLSGHVRRGDVETLEAALMFCDMHGFTDLSNRLSSERVLELLNIYFDEVVPSVAQCGGEILKFMGDGLLAFFRDDAGAGPSCAAALGAARIGQRIPPCRICSTNSACAASPSATASASRRCASTPRSDGFANDWHFVHLGQPRRRRRRPGLHRGRGGDARGPHLPAGSRRLERRGTSSRSRRIAHFIDQQGAVAGIQLAHAGRKASTRRPWSGARQGRRAREGGWAAARAQRRALRRRLPDAAARSTIGGDRTGCRRPSSTRPSAPTRPASA